MFDAAAYHLNCLRDQLRPQAQRLALAVLWPTHTQRDAELEMRAAVHRAIAPQGWRQKRTRAVHLATAASHEVAPGYPGGILDAVHEAHDAAGDKHPWSPEWRAFSDDLLNVTVEEMEALHAASRTSLQTTAAAILRTDGDRQAVIQAVVAQARGMLPLPPPRLVQEAIEKAAKEYRFETRFWSTRRRQA